MAITNLQLTALIIRVILATIGFNITLIFLLKIKNAQKTGIEISPFLGSGLMFFCFGITHVFWTYYEYNIYEYGLIIETAEMLMLYKGAVLAAFCGLIGIAFLCEKMFGKTKYIFTILSVISAVYAVVFLFTLNELRIFTFITMPIIAVFITFILIHTIIVKTKGEIRKKMVYAFLCLLGFYLLYLIDTEIGYSLLPFPREVVSMISMISALFIVVFWAQIFLSFETFSEFGWEKKLKELFIIAPNGATLFHYSFVKKTKTQSTDLISAGLTGVKDILAEMIQSKQALKTVDHQDVKILFEYGNYSTIALVVYEDFRIYRSKLTTLSTQFEQLFQDVLSHWTGDIEIFLPSKQLIEDVFG